MAVSAPVSGSITFIVVVVIEIVAYSILLKGTRVYVINSNRDLIF